MGVALANRTYKGKRRVSSFSNKESAFILGICPQKVNQAYYPALEKVALHLLADWPRAMDDLLRMADCLRK